MKKKILLVLMAVVFLLPVVFTGCQAKGIAQDAYDKVVAEVQEFQAKYTDALTKYDDLQVDKAAVDTQLAEARAKITEKDNQIASLKAQYELTGATPAETAAKIVKYYHETHVYSSYDLFVCSDMAAEVWNMLKAQGISSIVAVGNKDTAISDILLSNHAWVLAEVAAGQYLALETTGGFTVTASANILYYHGWSFDSPADLKSYNDLVKEYNTRVGFRNLLAGEVNNAMSLYNNSTNQVEADKWLALYNKLHELQTDQEAILNDLMTHINSLASVIQ
jgi:outer membrane murein-binding lipoprotein Lpp